MTSAMQASSSAERWGPLWGARPDDWATSEEQHVPGYEAALERILLESGQQVLDIGCGSGRLGEAIKQVDAETSSYPSYYMINCAHPTHFEERLTSGERWTERIRGLRANASRMSHAELNDAAELDIGNPHELGEHYAKLKRRLRKLNVLGGCCGTDHRHVEQIAAACLPLFLVAL